jgi:hypothetical protein
MENFIIEDQFHTWTIMLSKMEGTYNMFVFGNLNHSNFIQKAIFIKVVTFHPCV